MAEKEQATENTAEKHTQKPWLWKPGQSGNPAGRPKGAKNFATQFRKAVKEYAKKLELGEEPDAVEIQIIQKGIEEALSGKYPFYRDILDRVYGQPIKSIDVTTQGEKINAFPEARLKEIAKLILEKENGGESSAH
jgi:hypothetical protein